MPARSFGSHPLTHPCVENFHGGGLIDDGFLLAGIASGFAEFRGGAGGAEGFVHEDERDGWNACTQQIREGPDFCSGIALTAVHPQRQADDERVDAAQFRETRDALDGLGFRAIDGFHWMGEDAEIIGGGDADAGIAMIDAERGMRGVGFLGSHRAIGWREPGKAPIYFLRKSSPMAGMSQGKMIFP